MRKELQLLVADVVIKCGADDGCSSIPQEMIAAAVRVVPQLKPDDFAKFPDAWYPLISAKAVGAVRLKEGWGRLWFEALVEILYQSGTDGHPPLFDLWARDEKTYHGFVLVRLLRLAANGVRKKEILDMVKSRLPELAHRAGPECVEEVMLWASRGDDRLFKILKSMSKLKVKGIGDESVGSVMKEWADSRDIRL